MTAQPLTARLDQELIDRLDRLGAAYGRTRDELLAEALRRFLLQEEDNDARIEEALEDFREGRTYSHDEAKRRSQAHLERLDARRRAAE